MEKEIISEKNSLDTKDKNIENAKSNGKLVTGAVICILCLFFLIYNLFVGKHVAVNHAVSSIFWGFIATDSYEKYDISKRKVYLITTIAASITVILSLLAYIRVA